MSELDQPDEPDAQEVVNVVATMGLLMLIVAPLFGAILGSAASLTGLLSVAQVLQWVGSVTIAGFTVVVAVFIAVDVYNWWHSSPTDEFEEVSG